MSRLVSHEFVVKAWTVIVAAIVLGSFGLALALAGCAPVGNPDNIHFIAHFQDAGGVCMDEWEGSHIVGKPCPEQAADSHPDIDKGLCLSDDNPLRAVPCKGMDVDHP